MIDLRPKTCNLCGGKVIYTSNRKLYGTDQGSGHVYICTQCGAYTGTHIPRPREAKGTLANEEMRQLRIKCHELFDIRWRGRGDKKRAREYKWLAEQMGIPFEECHFGWFSTEQLKKAYNILLNDKKAKEKMFDVGDTRRA